MVIHFYPKEERKITCFRPHIPKAKRERCNLQRPLCCQILLTEVPYLTTTIFPVAENDPASIR